MDISWRVQRAYDQIAELYASRNNAMAGNLLALAERLRRHVGPAGRIIDLGCGAGRDMAWFESQGQRVTGADLSAGMLAQARRIADGDLLMMDMRRLAFRPASFDGVWCCAAILHLPKREA